MLTVDNTDLTIFDVCSIINKLNNQIVEPI